MLNRHVYIIGMPGSGKSSLGRRVASNLGLPFIDTDQRIEQSVGCSTSDIFRPLRRAGVPQRGNEYAH